MATCSLSASSCQLISKTRISMAHPLLSTPPSLHFRCRNFSCFFALSMPSSPALFQSFRSLSSSSSLLWTSPTIAYKSKLPKVFALVEEEQLAPNALVEDVNSEGSIEDSSSSNNFVRPAELYVCNLPRNCGISELHDIFKSYGTVQSVEVSRDAETGISRGCGYVTMGSIVEGKAAIAALDGSDVGGREMRVKFSVDMDTNRRNLEGLNSTTPKKNLIFESPFKLYVGNLAWSVKPEDLNNLFSQFGTVVSARVLHDRKAGKNRVYGFLSFSSAAESEAAIALNGTDFRGRTLVVREEVKNAEA